MMQQLSMFAMMEASGRQAALDWLLDFLRQDYYDYVETRAELLREGEDVAGLQTMEEFVLDLFKSHSGWYGMDGAWYRIDFSLSCCKVYEHGNPQPYEFTKFQICEMI